jgi:tetratricopeptide (TPR) repeat protein/DNA-binding CsgD family transcriptional regulator
MRVWILLMLLSVFRIELAAQTRSNLLNRLDQLIFDNPDSALVIFKCLEAEQIRLSDQQKGHLYSNKGIFYAMQGASLEAINFLQKAYVLSKPNSIQRSNSLKNLANVYRSNANYTKALSLLKRALIICQKNENKKEALSVLGEIAAVQYYQFNWSAAIQTNKRVISGLIKIRDLRLLAIQQQRLANIYYSVGRYNEAILVYKHSMNYYDKHAKDHLNSAYVRIGIGDVYFAQGNFKKAILYFMDATNRLKSKDVAKYWLANSKLAQAQLECGIFHDGFPRLQKSYIEANNLNLTNLDELLTYLLRYSKGQTQSINFFNRQISDIHQRKKLGQQFNDITWSALQQEVVEFYQATRQYELATAALVDLRRLDKALNADFQKEKSKRLLEKEVAKREHLRAKALKLDIRYYRSLRVLWFLSIFLVLALSGLYYYFSKAKSKGQKIQNLRLKLDNFELEERLELERKNVQLEQELHATKERELAAMSLQLFQLQESIKADIIAMDKKGINPDVKALQKKFNSSLKRKDYWKEFELKFIQLNPNFHQKLQNDHPSLTKKELDFCSLIRLNLGNKEIASLTQIAYESVLSKKYKLRKKMGFSTENDLFRYLHRL